MKRAPLLVSAGTVAGFIGILGFHSRQGPLATPAGGTSAAPAASSSPAPSSSGTAQTGPVAAGAARTATGPEEQFGYGQLDVKVTVRGSRITDVSVPVLQTAEPMSQQISQEAIGLLRPEVMSVQSGNINGVSGATYTSAAYAQSLQAALDKLHFK